MGSQDQSVGLQDSRAEENTFLLQCFQFLKTHICMNPVMRVCETLFHFRGHVPKRVGNKALRQSNLFKSEMLLKVSAHIYFVLCN